MQIVVRNETAAATTTVNVLALAAFVCVWGAIRSWTDGQVARQCVIGLALAPTSYYLWMYYAEGLLVATAAGAAWAARHRRHGWTVLAIAGAATARAPGIAVGPSLAIARVLEQRKIDRIAIAYAVAPLLGLLPVVAMQSAQVDDGLAWTKAGRAWGRELAAPWTPVWTGIRDIIDTLPKPAEGVALDLTVIFFVGLGASWLLIQARRANTPWEPGVLAATSWATALSSRLAASQIRYALAAWPVLIAVVQLLERMPRWDRSATVLGSFLFGAAPSASRPRGLHGLTTPKSAGEPPQPPGCRHG